MKKLITLCMMLLYSICFCVAQNNYGPRLTALGNNGAAVADIWSTDANPSGITAFTSPMAAINYTKFLFDTDLSKQAISFILPIKNNFAGLNFQRYGISEYNEIKAGITLAKQFGETLSIAVKANYHQIKISNYGATTGFSVDVGAMYKYNDLLTFGLYVNNPSLKKYSSKAISNSIPSVIHLGAAYKASDKLIIASTISKDFKTAVDVGLGIDYKLIELISLRGGLTAKPFKQYAGFGLNYKKLMLDVAVENDPYLDFKPQIALAYAF